MKKSVMFGMLCLGLALLSGNGAAQQAELKRQLVGTWMFVSSTGKLPDGSPTWGTNPKGVLIFTDNGYYASLIVRADVSKFAANNRLRGTADENKAAVQGGIGTFGTYTVDDEYLSEQHGDRADPTIYDLGR